MFCLFRGIGVGKLRFHLRFIVMRCFNIANCSGAALVAARVLTRLHRLAAPAAADPREVGIWYDDTGKGAVKIEICTPTNFCGKIYWLKEPMAENGQPKIDSYNPEPSMRTRPICGLPVLGDLEQISDGGFDNGWVYDPKEGKSYSVALDLVETGHAEGDRLQGHAVPGQVVHLDARARRSAVVRIPTRRRTKPASRLMRRSKRRPTKKNKSPPAPPSLEPPTSPQSSHKKKAAEGGGYSAAPSCFELVEAAGFCTATLSA